MAATSMAMPTSLSSCARGRKASCQHMPVYVYLEGVYLKGPTIVEDLKEPRGIGIEYWDGEGA